MVTDPQHGGRAPPVGRGVTLRATEEVDGFGQIRRGPFIGVMATLLLLGASLPALWRLLRPDGLRAE